MSSSQPSSAQPDDRGQLLYDERLSVPWTWWLFGLLVPVLVAVDVGLGVRGVGMWLPYVLLVPLPAWWLVWLGRIRVQVRQTPDGERELWVERAHLPVSVISRAAAVPASAKSRAMGRQLDPAAYVQHRAWVPTMAITVLDDPDDPTPYWLFSTRHPNQVLDALGLTAAADAPEPEGDAVTGHDTDAVAEHESDAVAGQAGDR